LHLKRFSRLQGFAHFFLQIRRGNHFRCSPADNSQLLFQPSLLFRGQLLFLFQLHSPRCPLLKKDVFPQNKPRPPWQGPRLARGTSLVETRIPVFLSTDNGSSQPVAFLHFQKDESSQAVFHSDRGRWFAPSTSSLRGPQTRLLRLVPHSIYVRFVLAWPSNRQRHTVSAQTHWINPSYPKIRGLSI